MFGKKSKLQRVKADARADYLKCASLDPEDRLHRVFSARIAQRARLNLDKIFVQGARAEEKRQQDLAKALKEGKKGLPQREKHDGYNSLKGTTGIVMSWVPEEYASTMFNLGADYQIQEKSARQCIAVADQLAEKLMAELQTLQKIELLNLLRLAITTDDTNEETENQK